MISSSPLLLLLLGLAVVHGADRLLVAQVIFNGGSHSPAEQLKGHHVDWPEGLNALNTDGVIEALRFGRHLRARYMDATLNASTLPSLLRMEACKSQLSQQTSSIVGAALWERVSEPWPRAWRPVVVHEAEESAKLDSMTLCPVADKVANTDVFSSPWFADPNNVAFLRLLLQRAGLGRLESWTQLHTLYETAIAIKQTSRGYPSWLEEGKVRTLKSFLDAAVAVAFNNEQVARLRAGPLLDDMLSRIDRKVACEGTDDVDCSASPLLYTFAVDTITLHALKSALGLSAAQLPTSVSGVSLELWKTDNEQYRVKVLHSDGSTGLREQAVAGCNDLLCPLTTFSTFLRKSYISQNWALECGLDDTSKIDFEPQSKFCDQEVDVSSAQKCFDWAKFNYCVKDEGVRYVYCRRTCLCDARFAAQARTLS